MKACKHCGSTTDLVTRRRECQQCYRARKVREGQLNPESQRLAFLRWKAKHPERAANIMRQASNAWKKRNPERVADADHHHRLRREYGMSIDDYNSMLAGQDGGCAICGANAPGGNYKKFHVDHDHSNGRVRGLLCARCNLVLGLFEDSRERFDAASIYLEVKDLNDADYAFAVGSIFRARKGVA